MYAKLKSFALLAVLMCMGAVAHAQLEGSKIIYESPKLAKLIPTHKTVAILPFTADVVYRRKNAAASNIEEEKRALGKKIQSAMFTFLTRRAGDYTVEIQDIDKTNIILGRNNALDNISKYTKDEIAKMLGVDAVLSGNYSAEQTKSEGAALASAVLFGGLGGKTGTGTLTLAINDGQSGDLLWRMHKTMNENIMGSADAVIEHMMRKVSRNFPYAKQ